MEQAFKSLEKRREEGRRALEEHRRWEERNRREKERSRKRKMRTTAVASAILLVLAALVAYAVISPGKYDEFAKCLTEKGAVMYGEDWCRYTQAQKAMFGKSFKYINYEVKPGLRIRPTWVINAKSYETVQSFERLSALTGCKY